LVEPRSLRKEAIRFSQDHHLRTPSTGLGLDVLFIQLFHVVSCCFKHHQLDVGHGAYIGVTCSRCSSALHGACKPSKLQWFIHSAVSSKLARFQRSCPGCIQLVIVSSIFSSGGLGDASMRHGLTLHLRRQFGSLLGLAGAGGIKST
jgi:hypothetical protein